MSASEQRMVVAQFVDHEGKNAGPPLTLPVETTHEQLEQLINQILDNVYVCLLDFFCNIVG